MKPARTPEQQIARARKIVRVLTWLMRGLGVVAIASASHTVITQGWLLGAMPCVLAVYCVWLAERK